MHCRERFVRNLLYISLVLVGTVIPGWITLWDPILLDLREERDFVRPCSVSQAMLPHHKAALHSFQLKWRKLCLSYLGWAILWVFQHHFMMTENYREYSEISDSKRNLEKKGYFQKKLFILCSWWVVGCDYRRIGVPWGFF